MLPSRILIALAVLLTFAPFAHSQDSPDRQLQDAAYDGNFGEVKRLLAAGANINASKEPGATPLCYATLEQHEDIALFLIERGAALNRRGGPKGDTALMNAAAFNELSVIRALLRRGARTDLRCEVGMTAREHAIRNHHSDAAKLFDKSKPK